MRVALGEKGLKDMYAYYLVKAKSPVTYKEYVQICTAHNKLLMELVLYYSANIRLPHRLGYLRIKKTKMNYKYLKLDYGTYNKTGEMVYHLNEHSDDFKARFLWEKSKCVVKGKRPYCFQPTREHKRSLAEIMKSPGGHKIFSEE